MSRRQFCPACLAEAPFHRAAWDLVLVGCCPHHAVQLIAGCSRCGAPSGWAGPGVVECKALVAPIWAGWPHRPPTVPRRKRPPMSWHSRPGRPLDGCQRRCAPSKAATCCGWRCLSEYWPAIGRVRRRPEALAAAGSAVVAGVAEAGIQFLRAWPGPLHELVAAAAAGAGGRPGRFGVRRTLGPLHGWLASVPVGPARNASVAASRTTLRATLRSSPTSPGGHRSPGRRA
ncbi:TniQ family protein [Dankookia sp. P2]|uniref:TniQ family protein n=1 Tax=Dankookia sp. P2 TaxID=3423955 RepID=UPI003D67F596